MQLNEWGLGRVNLIHDIHAASRHLVRELGFMNRTLAGTNLSASEIHTIVEIGAAGELSAKSLAQKLILEKSTISRVLASLVAKGELREMRSKTDARAKLLRLTAKGKQTFNHINQFAERQVANALAGLDSRSRQEILFGLQGYAKALERGRSGIDIANHEIGIEEGYTPGLIGRIVELHAVYYSALVGFGLEFEKNLAGDLVNFVERIEDADNAIWSLRSKDAVVGSVAIDGKDLGKGEAHLRWFIVADSVRGTGCGRALLQTAIDFCADRGFSEISLWTFSGLDAARHLYEALGFTLVDEYSGDQWGRTVSEQKFVRRSRV